MHKSNVMNLTVDSCLYTSLTRGAASRSKAVTDLLNSSLYFWRKARVGDGESSTEPCENWLPESMKNDGE